MKNLSYLAFSAALAATMSSGGASAMIVGGVDFGSTGSLSHIETGTLAQTLITGNGQTLTGYGEITTINGLTNYAGADKLYYVFTYTSQNFSPSTVEFVDGVVKVYKGLEFNLSDQSSAQNLTDIQALDPWVQFNGHANLGGIATPSAELFAFGTLSGGVFLNVGGTGLLDVDTSGAFGLPSVADLLDGNGIPDNAGGLADLTVGTISTNLALNQNDPACTGAAGEWCLAGSGNFQGIAAAVPIPATLLLFGSGILSTLGLGLRSRRVRLAPHG